MDDEDDQTDHQQQMDKRAANVKREEAEGPKDEDDYRDRQKHGAFPLVVRARNGRTAAAFRGFVLDQPRLLHGRFDEAREQRMRLERPALELGMELDADEPRMVGPLDDFGQLTVGRHAGKDQSRSLERVTIVDVDLVAVAVPLADRVGAVDRADNAIAVELGRIGAEPHRPTEISAGGALL